MLRTQILVASCAGALVAVESGAQATTVDTAGTATATIYHGVAAKVIKFEGLKSSPLDKPSKIQPQVQKQGSLVCFVVANANPALYDYSVGSVAESEPAPVAGLSDLVA